MLQDFRFYFLIVTMSARTSEPSLLQFWHLIILFLTRRFFFVFSLPVHFF